MRLEQLERMTDEELAAEIRQHQGAQWRPTRLVEHVRKHRRDFERSLGHGLTAPELERLSHEVLRSWERLFTRLERDGSVTYFFVRSLLAPHTAMIVATRGGLIRTAFPTADFTRRVQRDPARIEVTARAGRLGL